MKDGVKETIKIMFSQGLELGDISEALGLPVDVIKPYVKQNKPKEEAWDHIEDEDARLLKNGLMEIAMNGESEFARLNALKYLFDEKKGRNSKAALVGATQNFSVIQINQVLAEASSKAKKAIDSVRQLEVIDVGSSGAQREIAAEGRG